MNASLEGIGFQKALPALIFLTAMFLLNFMTRTVLSPLLSELEADLAISHAQAGRLFLFLALGVSLGSFANGLVSKRISHRATVSASAFFAGLMLMAASRALSYPLFAAGLFLLGLFSGLYFPSALAAITSYVRKPDWGKAIGVHDSAASLSFILIPLFAELILLAGSWRDTLLTLGAIQAATAVVFSRWGFGRESFGDSPRPVVLAAIIPTRQFWLLSFFFGIAAGASIGSFSMLPLYLITEHGYARETANTLLSTARISGLFMTLAAGYATDRLGAKTTLLIYFTSCAALTALYGLTSGPLLLATIFLQSAVATCFFAPGFTLLSRAFAGPSQNVATSVIALFATFIGQGLVPAMLGAAGSAGHFGAGFLILGGLLFVCLALLRWLPG